MVEAIGEFIDFLLGERGASANTVIAYRKDLEQLAAHVREHLHGPRSTSWNAVNEAVLVHFVQDLRERGYRESSVARKVAVVRSFFAFLIGRGLIRNNPTARLSPPRVAKGVPVTLAPAEIEKLLEQPARRFAPDAKRDRAMLELLYFTGMRVSELVSLDVTDVRLGDASSVLCPTRQARRRIIPIRCRAVATLRSYIDEARPNLVLHRKEPALFLNRRGERLTRQGLWLIFRKYALAAGLSSGIAPKALRHSFASHRLCHGVSVGDVQETLGHARISTTRIPQVVLERGLHKSSPDGGCGPSCDLALLSCWAL